MTEPFWAKDRDKFLNALADTYEMLIGVIERQSALIGSLVATSRDRRIPDESLLDEVEQTLMSGYQGCAEVRERINALREL